MFRNTKFLYLYVDDIEIKPLILNAVRKYSNDERIERVVCDMLRETLQEHYHGGSNWNKRFSAHLKDSILHHFNGNVDNE